MMHQQYLVYADYIAIGKSIDRVCGVKVGGVGVLDCSILIGTQTRAPNIVKCMSSGGCQWWTHLMAMLSSSLLP